MKKKSSRQKRKQLITDEQRVRLLHGPYEPPLVKHDLLEDAERGQVKVGGFTNALIPLATGQENRQSIPGPVR